VKALVAKTWKFLRADDGPTATEYAVMLALIAMVAVAAFGQFGERVSGIYSVVDSTMPDV
jgi:pilus assembly protein Flp/PilA